MNKRDASNVINELNEDDNSKTNLSNNIDAYTKFKIKFITYDILMLLFVFVGVFLIRKSFLFVDSQIVTYKENSNLVNEDSIPFIKNNSINLFNSFIYFRKFK